VPVLLDCNTFLAFHSTLSHSDLGDLLSAERLWGFLRPDYAPSLSSHLSNTPPPIYKSIY